MTMHWRLVLALLPALSFAEWTQLFNGRDLSGWTMVGPGRFVIEDGMLKTEGGMGLLYYNRRRVGNETIRVVFRPTTSQANSGVFIRMPDPPADAWYGVHNGYEVQIDGNPQQDDWHSTGALYSIAKVSKRAQKPAGEWNTMEIRLEGKQTTVVLNGETVNVFQEGSPVPPRKSWWEPVRGPRPVYGYIGLQNHDAASTVYFKEISVSGAARPIEARERSFGMSYLHAVRKQILDAIEGLSDAQWHFKPGPERWSIAEVMEHLVASGHGIWAMVNQALTNPASGAGGSTTDEALLKTITDRSQRAQAPAEIRPVGRFRNRLEASAEFKNALDPLIAFLETTQEPLRQRRFAFGPSLLDAYQGVLAVAAHAERHLKQIQEVKSSSGYPNR
jgi:hypothetical protein